MEWLGRITGQLVNPNLLVAAIACELEAVCQTIAAGKHEDILSEWRKYSITLNKDIIAISGNKTITGKAEDIDSSGALLVRTNNGEIMRLSSAEISIRSLDGSYA
jgi:BirA family biotin operon repressor/biotin-[acetyl-CoA-carboxylase] ligase